VLFHFCDAALTVAVITRTVRAYVYVASVRDNLVPDLRLQCMYRAHSVLRAKLCLS